MKGIVFVCLMFCMKVFAASSLFHVVIAEKWLEAFEDYNEEQRRAFILGTIFPDIRYLAGLPRRATHERNLTIEEILEIENPFIKGMKVHSFVDEARVAYLCKSDILKLLDNVEDDKVLLLKMLEDEILFSMREKEDCEVLCSYLQMIEEEELSFGIPLEVVQQWHQQHIGYFSLGPRRFFTKLLSKGRQYGAIPESTLQTSLRVFENFAEDEAMKNYIFCILEDFKYQFQCVPLGVAGSSS
jgi:hypothetical protein